MMLEGPVRVRKGVWLIPESFADQLAPKVIALSTSAPAAAPAPAPVAASRMPVALEDLRFRSYPSFTRIVIETSGPLTYRVDSAGGKESRIRLQLLAGFPRVQEVGDGFIDEARLERAGDDAILRVVFEGAPGEMRASTLADPPRLVLDFARPAEPAPRERRESVAPLRLVVLDAGHGGHDTGAIGPGGLQEKELVLDVTRRVARLLEDKLDVKVLLSRDTDHFVTLRDRTTYANKERADLFVSIHANAHREMTSAGVETYFLSSEATDGTARQVAALENSVVQLEKTSARATGRLDAVKAILWDLAQSEFQQESSRLAEVVQDSMTQSLRMPNRGVKQAGFYVLGGAAMPAILIEIGFVTNPREERRLKESKYRDEIARAIFAGLADYKKRYDGRARDVTPNARAPRER
jgi:N-acetylmuramoyl-L-alanine amidase